MHVVLCAPYRLLYLSLAVMSWIRHRYQPHFTVAGTQRGNQGPAPRSWYWRSCTLWVSEQAVRLGRPSPPTGPWKGSSVWSQRRPWERSQAGWSKTRGRQSHTNRPFCHSKGELWGRQRKDKEAARNDVLVVHIFLIVVGLEPDTRTEPRACSDASPLSMLVYRNKQPASMWLLSLQPTLSRLLRIGVGQNDQLREHPIGFVCLFIENPTRSWRDSSAVKSPDWSLKGPEFCS